MEIDVRLCVSSQEMGGSQLDAAAQSGPVSIRYEMQILEGV
jgi:hypothetical protein